MPAVCCPGCDEPVRLPAAKLPEDASVQCPWCNETWPVQVWQMQLPPLATVLGPDGSPLVLTEEPATEPTEAETDDQTPQTEQVFDAAPSELAGSQDEPESTASAIEPDSEPMASEEDAFAEDDEPIDLDETIDLDEHVSMSGLSIIASNQDGETVEAESAANSIDELEQAWDSPEAWGSPEAWSSQEANREEEQFDEDHFDEGDFDEDDFERELASETPNAATPTAVADSADFVAQGVTTHRTAKRANVPYPEDQHSDYARHHWGKQPRDAVRLLKIAAPTLIALPIIGLILYWSGINLGFPPFNATKDEANAKLAMQSAEPRSASGADENESDTSKSPLVGRVLVDSEPSAPKQDNAEQDNAEQNDPEQGSAAETVLAESHSESPSEIVASLFAPDQVAGPTEAEDSAVRQASAEQSIAEATPGESLPEIDDVIQSLGAQIAKEDATGEQADDDQQPRKTIEMAARERMAENAADITLDPVQAEIATLNRATLAFPQDPPSADSIKPSQPPPEPDAAEIANDSAPELNSLAASETATAGINLPATETPQRESLERIAAIGDATASIDRLVDWQVEATSKKAVLARLLAYRAVSRIGSLPIESGGENTDQLFARLVDPTVLAQLEPLCGAWIDWGRRKTDGILLIGQLRHEDTQITIELSDGTTYQVQLADQVELPTKTRVVALGKIISTEDVPLVRLVAGAVVP